MRRAGVWILTIAGLVGLLMALTFEGRGGPQGSAFRMGLPDAWVEWESTPNGHTFGVYILRWSFGILVASVYALYYAVRLSRHTQPQKPAEPGAAPDRGGR